MATNPVFVLATPISHTYFRHMDLMNAHYLKTLVRGTLYMFYKL